MLLQKIKEKGIDLFILIKDDMNYLYEAHDYMVHANYDSYQLIFKFEDWTHIINDGKEHMYIIAEYENADNCVLVKFQSEDFDELLNEVKIWNDKHKLEKKLTNAEVLKKYLNKLSKLSRKITDNKF